MIAKSFANIVKTNNGLFKSPQQAEFLLSQCTNREFSTSGAVHGNSFIVFYQCDELGVVNVKKQTAAKGLIVQWERKVEGQVSIQDANEIKRLTRLIRETERSIANRQAAYDRGDYPSEALFNESQQRDIQQLATVKSMLTKLKVNV